jgi:4-hydroxybenzoyl-CoA reductase subunit alpha
MRRWSWRPPGSADGADGRIGVRACARGGHTAIPGEQRRGRVAVRPEELRGRQAASAVPPEELDGDATAVIGRRNRKVDGYGKVTGATVYTDDMVLPGMLHGKILRSPHPHARIVSIDTSAAEALPGVHAVVTGRDMPVTYCVIPWTRDEYPLCVDRVRYIGDGVAAVAAVDEDTANRALHLIRVEYELLEAVLEPERALEPDAPQIHEAGKPGRNGNVTKHVRLEFGDVDGALAGSDVMVEGEYFFQGSTHTPIEPHCAIGWYDPSGKLTVWSATQVPHYLHRELARVLDLDVARIRVVQPAVGGAFGGKSEPFDLEFCVAALSRKCGRPVKILYTREEVFYSHRGRHPMKMSYRTGASADGRIRAVDGRLLLDGGAYASFGLVTAYYSGQLLTAPYTFETYRFDSTRVYTNKPACGPKRGHGSVQPRFAFEVQLDKVAERLGMDPIELRRRNFIGERTRTINGLRVTSNGFLQCLEAVERASDWKAKHRRMPHGRGVGVAGSCYISGTNYPIYPNEMPQAAIQLQVERSGRVAVFTGASEIGQGSNSMVAYIVAEELGVPLDYVRVHATDTDMTPVDLGAYSSRETFMVGNACVMAAADLRKKVAGAVAAEWDVPAARVGLAGGWAFDLQDTGGACPSARRSTWPRPPSARSPPWGITTRRRTSTATTAAVPSAPRPPIPSLPTSRKWPWTWRRASSPWTASGSPTTAAAPSTRSSWKARWRGAPTWASRKRSWRSRSSRARTRAVRGCTTRRPSSTTASRHRWTRRSSSPSSSSPTTPRARTARRKRGRARSTRPSRP